MSGTHWICADHGDVTGRDDVPCVLGRCRLYSFDERAWQLMEAKAQKENAMSDATATFDCQGCCDPTNPPIGRGMHSGVCPLFKMEGLGVDDIRSEVARRERAKYEAKRWGTTPERLQEALDALSEQKPSNPTLLSGRALTAFYKSSEEARDTTEALRLLDEYREERSQKSGCDMLPRAESVRRLRLDYEMLDECIAPLGAVRSAGETFGQAARRLVAENATLRANATIAEANYRAAVERERDSDALRAFVAAVAALPCVHGRKREDGPCPAYVGALECSSCAARRLMADAEPTG